MNECVGADPAALDTSLHTPFHVAILQGNTPVVRHLISLYRNTKSTDPKYQPLRDGCHPSKAAKDKNGSTPLQLAMKSENIAVIEVLLKDATVHDIERCWGQLDENARRGQLGAVLLTKVSHAGYISLYYADMYHIEWIHTTRTERNPSGYVKEGTA